MSDDFLYRDVPALGRRVFRLGLATNYGVDGQDLEWALEQGVNYVFWTPNARRERKQRGRVFILDNLVTRPASPP